MVAGEKGKWRYWYRAIKLPHLVIVISRSRQCSLGTHATVGSGSTLRARRSSSLLTVWSNCLFLVDFESHASSGSNRSNERWKIVPPAIHNVAERYIHTRYNFTTILDFSVGGSAIYDDKYEAYWWGSFYMIGNMYIGGIDTIIGRWKGVVFVICGIPLHHHYAWFNRRVFLYLLSNRELDGQTRSRI